MNAPMDEQQLAEIRSLDLLALMSERSAATVSGHLTVLLAEVFRLRAERHSTNEALSDAAETLRAQRDRIAELETLLSDLSEPDVDGAGRTYAEYYPPPRQLEDPHTSPLHHDYVLPRDLPTVPRQTTGRCPNCAGTFEDCTCGGAA